MSVSDFEDIGAYRGIINPRITSPVLRRSLSGIQEAIAASSAKILQAGRHKNIRIDLLGDMGPFVAVAKVFGGQSLLKDAYDRVNGSKAFRTYCAALHLYENGVGTSPPVAVLERWQGLRLKESIFVSLYLEGTISCTDILGELWTSGAKFSEFFRLICAMAKGIRRFHDSGILHGDLGNQNIFYTKKDGAYLFDNAIFLDLNRADYGHLPTNRERAKDLARLALPSGFMKIFFNQYWNGDVPSSFEKDYYFYRRPFEFHTATRALRHPFRELKYRRDPSKAPAQALYPSVNREFVWDDQSFSPAPVHTLIDDVKLIEKSFLSRLKSERKRLLSSIDMLSWRRRVTSISDGKGVLYRLIVEGLIEKHDYYMALLEKEGIKRVLVRFSQFDSDDLVASKLSGVDAFIADDIGVAIVIAQAPSFFGKDFKKFANAIMKSIHGRLDWVSIGQGINSDRWAIRSAKELEDIVAVGERLIYDNPTGRTPIATPVVEAPVMQLCCGNLQRLFAKNTAYAYLTMEWRRSAGVVFDEALLFHAIASRTYFSMKKIILISDSPWIKNSEQEREISLLVSEICYKA